MEYKLVEEYFETKLFQEIVGDYFNSVLKGILNFREIISAKGWFHNEEGELIKADLYDMPYHIHVLNGLMPALLVYEKWLLKKGWIDTEGTEVYVKCFMLGFTFHDANKLFKREPLEDAVNEIDKHIEKLNLENFLPDCKQYMNEIKHLAVGTEDGTAVFCKNFPIKLSNDHYRNVLTLLCNFADGIASVKTLDSTENIYNNIIGTIKRFDRRGEFEIPQISYISLYQNPYTLIGNELLSVARSFLYKKGYKVLFKTRGGIIYFGDDLKAEEVEELKQQFCNQESGVNIISNVTITAQQCALGFLGSVPFTHSVIDSIVDEVNNKFLALSPNGSDKIIEYEDFINFNKSYFSAYKFPIDIYDKEGKVSLSFSKNIDDEQQYFIDAFVVNKMKWLSGTAIKEWDKDYKQYALKEIELPVSFEFKMTDEKERRFSKLSDIVNYLKEVAKTPAAFLKNYLCLLKTYIEIAELDEEEIEDYKNGVKDELIEKLEVKGDNKKDGYFNQYFEARGVSAAEALLAYSPLIPEKRNMCSFTGGVAKHDYKDSIAFGLKARGFTNRTVTTLNNTKSKVSDLVAEENILRKSNYFAKSNTCVYCDFFETTLDINTDIISAGQKAKGIITDEDGKLKISKSAKFKANLDGLEYLELGGDIKSIFFFVWRQLMLVKHLNIRSYVTDIMSPFQSHQEAFYYANAPRVIKDLGWDKVRLIEIDEVLDEYNLLRRLCGGQGKKGNYNTSLVLDFARSRNAIFKAFYLFKQKNDDKNTAYAETELVNYTKKYKSKFKGMSIIGKLADIAVKIDADVQSGSKETWLIRTALDFLQKNIKEKQSKEDTIAQISGSIYKTLRNSGYVDTEAISEFSTVVYEELYEKVWKGKLPPLNRQKDWIYQFAFVFRQKVKERINTLSDEKIKRTLSEKGIELTRENIASVLSEKQKKYEAEISSRLLK